MKIWRVLRRSANPAVALEDHGPQRISQFVQSALAHGDGRNNRHTKVAGQSSGIKLQAISLCQIHHVECYDDRQPKCDKFQRESQMIVQIGCIENHDQDVGLPLTGLSAQNDIASDLFVGAGRSEEHTSEIQSLMRISYAVFCLKKKKQTTHV